MVLNRVVYINYIALAIDPFLGPRYRFGKSDLAKVDLSSLKLEHVGPDLQVVGLRENNQAAVTAFRQAIGNSQQAIGIYIYIYIYINRRPNLMRGPNLILGPNIIPGSILILGFNFILGPWVGPGLGGP